MAKRGRPQFKVTAAHRRSVEQLVAIGESHDSIARAIGCDDDTLRKHFAAELATGLSKRRKEVVDKLFAMAREGNVSAAKRLEEMTRIAAAAEQYPASTVPKPERLGKKETALSDARQAAEAGGKYAPPAPPKLVVNNE